jgi:hypothetical protein
MDPRKYAEAVLEGQIAELDEMIGLLDPFAGDPSELGRLYSECAALDAVADVWDAAAEDLYAARIRAQEDHEYGLKKLDHLYV